MSVTIGADSNGPFARWKGDHRKFRFEALNPIKKARAIEKAKARGADLKLKKKNKR